MADEEDMTQSLEQNQGQDAQAEEQSEQRARWRKRDEGRHKPAAPERADGGTNPTTSKPHAAEQTPFLEGTIQERVATEQAKAEEATSKLARVQADFANYKRRSEQEREQQAKFATLLLVTELLPVLDNFDRALATIPEELRGMPWTEGLLLVDRQLRATLEKQGLKPIEAVGTRFDPMLHEAIISEPSSEHRDDEVIAELQRGYMLHDKVVRPTLVKVAKNTGSAAGAYQSFEER